MFATVAAAVPLTPPLVAVTVYGPPAVAPPENSPLELLIAPPETVQAKLGCELDGLPN